MLETEIRDFSYFSHEFKDNYRKGVHRLRGLLSAPLTADQFAQNLGGVSVVFGTPEGREDRNSAELRSILLSSGAAEQAVETWLHGSYTFQKGDMDGLLSSMETCRELAGSAFLFRVVGKSGIAVGKLSVTLAGGDCRLYKDIKAVADSETAMDAVADSETAMAAVVNSETAMAAIAASSTAMTAIWQSETAVQAVKNNADAWATFTGASSAVMGKTVALLAGLDPSTYADMTAIAASSTAMTAVAASQTAMTAVAASQTAMTAVAASAIAMSAVSASSVAVAALKASPLCTVFNPTNQNAWRTDTFNGSGILIRISNLNASSAYYNIDNGSNTTITAQQVDPVKAYSSKLVVYWVDYSGPSDRGIYRIVLTGN